MIMSRYFHVLIKYVDMVAIFQDEIPGIRRGKAVLREASISVLDQPGS